MRPKTKVKFLYHRKNKDLFAFFPEENEGGNYFRCYSQVGQHSKCSQDYADLCIPALEPQYESLKAELEQIGYDLLIEK